MLSSAEAILPGTHGTKKALRMGRHSSRDSNGGTLCKGRKLRGVEEVRLYGLRAFNDTAGLHVDKEEEPETWANNIGRLSPDH